MLEKVINLHEDEDEDDVVSVAWNPSAREHRLLAVAREGGSVQVPQQQLEEVKSDKVMEVIWIGREGWGIAAVDQVGRVRVWVKGGFCAVETVVEMEGMEKVKVQVTGDLGGMAIVAWGENTRVFCADTGFIRMNRVQIQRVGVEIAGMGREFSRAKKSCVDIGKVWKKTISIFENKMSLLDELLEKQGETHHTRKSALLAFMTTG
jgi:hypothetical protein